MGECFFQQIMRAFRKEAQHSFRGSMGGGSLAKIHYF